ncbi:MAG: MFS transporter [Dehalococcoidia bacterium]
MVRGERSLIGALSLAHGLVHAIEITYAILLTRIGDDLGVGVATLGFVANASAFTLGASSLPAGYLTDRLGSRNVFYLTFLGAAGAAVLVGLSPNIVVLGLTLGVLGFTVGLYHPPAIALLAQSTRQRGIALGYHGIVGNMGLALSPLVATALAAAFDWRAAYFFLAGLAVVVVFLLRWILPQISATAAYQQARPAHRGEGSQRHAYGDSLLPLFTVFAVLILTGFIYRGALTFLPAHLEAGLKFELFGRSGADLAGFLVTPLLLMGGIGQYVGGWLSQRFTLERLAPAFTLLLAPALLFTGAGSGVVLLVAAAGYIFFSFGAAPVYDLLIADYTPPRFLGRSYGLAFFAASGIGSLGGTFAGLFAQRWDTAAVYLALSGFGVIVTLLSLTLWLRSLQERPAPVAIAADGGDG